MYQYHLLIPEKSTNMAAMDVALVVPEKPAAAKRNGLHNLSAGTSHGEMPNEVIPSYLVRAHIVSFA